MPRKPWLQEEARSNCCRSARDKASPTSPWLWTPGHMAEIHKLQGPQVHIQPTGMKVCTKTAICTDTCEVQPEPSAEASQDRTPSPNHIRTQGRDAQVHLSDSGQWRVLLEGPWEATEIAAETDNAICAAARTARNTGC